MDSRLLSTSNNELFCYFAGMTLGLCKVTAIKKDNKFGTCHITLAVPDDARIQHSYYVQLDGVLCAATAMNEKQFSVVTTNEMIDNTTLKNVKLGNNVSLGIMAELEEKNGSLFLIHPSASTVATVENVSILAGHRYTLKIDLTCPSLPLKEEKHIGIAGSALLVRELKSDGVLCHFSIYAGRKTRESTILNNDNIKKGDKININLAKEDILPDQEYPYALQSIKPR